MRFFRFSSSAVDGPRCFSFRVEAKANNTTRGQRTNKNLIIIIIITVRAGRSRKRIEPKETGIIYKGPLPSSDNRPLWTSSPPLAWFNLIKISGHGKKHTTGHTAQTCPSARYPYRCPVPFLVVPILIFQGDQGSQLIQILNGGRWFKIVICKKNVTGMYTHTHPITLLRDWLEIERHCVLICIRLVWWFFHHTTSSRPLSILTLSVLIIRSDTFR